MFFAYETSCLFGDLAAIAVAIAKTSDLHVTVPPIRNCDCTQFCFKN